VPDRATPSNGLQSERGEIMTRWKRGALGLDDAASGVGRRMSPIWQGKNETVLYIIELLQLSPQSGSLERALPRTALQSRDHLSSKEARCILKICLSSCLVDLLAWSIGPPLAGRHGMSPAPFGSNFHDEFP